MRILALDLGKFKSVACVYESVSAEHQYRTVPTVFLELVKLVEETKPERVVIEISSVAGWVGDMVRSLGIELQVANTNDSAWSWRKLAVRLDTTPAVRFFLLGLDHRG